MTLPPRPAFRVPPRCNARAARLLLGAVPALLVSLAALALASAPADPSPHPPVAVRFTLKEPGYVTLVIDDEKGLRVRNLVSETYFPAGDNVAWWDATDDLGRDNDAARHGVYHIPARPVAPGTYRVAGLYRKAVELHYEFSIYTAGNPPWPTKDHTGGWLANHTPPNSAASVSADRAPGGKPLVLLGSFVTEGGDGIAWVDLDGRKLGGKGWLGGVWTGAQFLACDRGREAEPDVYAYAGAAWSTTTDPKKSTDNTGEIRLTALMRKGDKHADRPVLKYTFTLPADVGRAPGGDNKYGSQMGGLAAHAGLLVFSLPHLNQLVFVDAKAKQALGAAAAEDPRGVAFDAQGRLLVLSGVKLCRYDVPAALQPTVKLPPPRVVVAAGLDDPQQLALDSAGNIYVSDHGGSHQVKVWAPDGRPLRAIGTAGPPRAGPYDPNHMNNPAGLTVDADNRLWVTENDFQPKRVSVWTLDGKLLKAFYGPAEYGGGGRLDHQDKTRFYIRGMEFKLDWDKGSSQLAAVLFRPAPGAASLPGGPPELPIYVAGRRYFTNCYNSHPTNGAPVGVIWLERSGVAVPVAAFGAAHNWDLLKTDAFKPRWPAGVDPTKDRNQNPALFLWYDLSGDGQPQPDEVVMIKKKPGGITVMPDLSFVAARSDDLAVRLRPLRFTAQGVPVYDLAAAETVASGAQPPRSSGGDQVLAADDGWAVLTVAAKPFAPESVGGVCKGAAVWSYPSVWPGLHASHESSKHEFAGELIGTTRLLGGFIRPKGSQVGPLWAINGNMGNMYILTADGLFVATLFKDVRQAPLWSSFAAAQRNMDVTDTSLHDECFWPSITQTPDGKVYLVAGDPHIVRVDGLGTLSRLPPAEVRVTAADLEAARAWVVESEAGRQRALGPKVLKVAIRADAPVVDGKLDDWAGADWAQIDTSGTKAWFNSKSKPYNLAAAVAVSGDRLYAAFKTDSANLLANTGEDLKALFKTGGALDLEIGTDARADPKRTCPAAGDVRLLVARAGAKTVAVLYRPVAPGAGGERIAFSSPQRTIMFDRVDDVSREVTFASTVEKDKDGWVTAAYYEISCPLAVLGLKPEAGRTIRADLGVLRGNGVETVHRVYWSNKATAITADVPSEAELAPHLWGQWTFAP